MKKTAIAIGLMLASSVAMAQQTQPKFYVGVGAGQASIDLGFSGEDIAAEILDLGANSATGSVDDNVTAWKIFGGYQFNRYLAVEGGYANFGTAEAAGSGNFGATPIGAKAEFKGYGVFVDVVGHLPASESFSVFGKAGLAYTRAEASLSASVAGNQVFSDSVRESEVVPKLGVGLRYNFTPMIGVRAEFEKYFDVGDSNTTGEDDVDMWSVSMTFNF